MHIDLQFSNGYTFTITVKARISVSQGANTFNSMEYVAELTSAGISFFDSRQDYKGATIEDAVASITKALYLAIEQAREF